MVTGTVLWIHIVCHPDRQTSLISININSIALVRTGSTKITSSKEITINITLLQCYWLKHWHTPFIVSYPLAKCSPFPSFFSRTFSPSYISSSSCCQSEPSFPRCYCSLPTEPDCTSPHFEFPGPRSLCSLSPTLLTQATHPHSCKVKGGSNNSVTPHRQI